jgi:glutathionyl-hydroquinone reductase
MIVAERAQSYRGLMGQMIDGRWFVGDVQAQQADDSGDPDDFVRPTTTVRDWIARGEAGRYRLIIMRGCPWAHRTYLVWRLEGLQDVVELVTTAGRPSDQGWIFDDHNPDPEGRRALHAYYAEGVERFTGRVTVPVLWDKRERRIVNNESADIIQILDSAFDHLLDRPRDLYPTELRGEIDRLNDWVYRLLNDGVYRAGFAGGEAAHVAARRDVFSALERLEQHLSNGREYLVGECLTLADVRAFPTLARFPAYASAFRCNERPLTDYPALWAYTRRIAAVDGVADTLLDPMDYVMGYRSIPFAVGHHDPLPAAPPPLL